LLYNPYSEFGNILDGAKLLRDYLDLYGTYPLAFKRYKGWTKLGEKQSQEVMKIYRSLK
jgi:hypothetical protein